MAEIVFSRQLRADGGERTGLSVGETTVLGNFVSGKGKLEPYLKWFVDVRCEGKLSADPDEARQWMLDHADVLQKGLLDMANKFRAGMDVDAVPVVNAIKRMPHGVRASITFAASNAASARQISKVLTGTAEEWTGLLAKLHVLQAA